MITIAQKGKAKEVVKLIWREFPGIFKEAMTDIIPKVVRQEANLLFRENCYRLDKTESILNFSYQKQDEIVQKNAPFINLFAEAVAVNPRIKRCKKKTRADCVPGKMTGLATMLFQRNHQNNATQVMNTCVLRRGQVKKEVYGR